MLSIFKCQEKLTKTFSLQYLICGPRCVDQVAENGGSRRSSDRTHDYNRGRRRQPTGPAGALITRTSLYKSVAYLLATSWILFTFLLIFGLEMWPQFYLLRYTWPHIQIHPWWVRTKTRHPRRMTTLMTTQTSLTQLVLMKLLLTWLLQVRGNYFFQVCGLSTFGN